jgi:hypothetical protein
VGVEFKLVGIRYPGFHVSVKKGMEIMDELTGRLDSIEGQVVDLDSKLDEMRNYIEDEIRWGIVHSVRRLITVAFATTYFIVGFWWVLFVIFSK